MVLLQSAPMIGETLAHYRVTEKIGAGGMGEVYRATDSRLHREVAIKVLPAALANDGERMARFEREAQVLASLSHPSIAAVYGLEESAGHRALVMELVDGEDLSDRLRRGPLPLGDVLQIARQIAEALEAAHERGIVHRDLKPANVKVTSDGHVKVLDFGLAKALEGSAANQIAAAGLTNTISAANTRAGVIMGTAAYMSPEQATGAVVDKRADVWSFGVVLFEMLTNRRLFEGETATHTLADVIRAEIDWSRLPATTPRAVRHLLERCLERDARRRLRDIGEARIEIERQLEQSASTARSAPVRVVTPAGWRQSAPWLALGLIAGLLVAGAAAVLWRPTPARPANLRMDVKLTAAALWTQIGPALEFAPDGSRVAFVTGTDTRRQLHVRTLDQLDSATLAEGAGEGTSPYHPFFSPDGAWIGYATSDELRKVPVSGGTSLSICKVSRSRGAAWAPDDTIVFAPAPDSGLFRVSAAGGEPQRLTTLDKTKKEASHRWPQVLPGGQAVLFTSNAQSVGNFDQASIEVVVLKTGARTLVHSGGAFGRYVPSGHLVYVNKGTIFAVPFDPRTFKVSGTPAPVVQNVTSSQAEGAAQIAFSPTGLMGYVRGGPLVPQYPVVWVDRDGRTVPLLNEPGAYANPRLSPDGRRVALTVLRDSNWDVWVYDLERQVTTRLTFDEGTDTEQIWSPDGREIMFSSDRHAQPSTLYRKPSDGSGEEKVVVKTDVHMWASSWSPDGQTVTVSTPRSNFDIGLVHLDTSKTDWLLTTPFSETDAAFSPDGRWVAYVSSESGQSEVYIRPLASNGGRWQISDAGGAYPRWTRDGRELVYRTNDGIMAASIDVADNSLRTGKPRQLFSGAFRGGIGGIAIAGNTFADYDMTGDGQRFVMFPRGAATGEERAGIVTVVSSWFDDLSRAFAGR
jgi:Tol biopolymer transport system component/tRNA A-37 threonylcarbamoyl transferase component Bud32